MKKIFIILACAGLTLTSCEDFLKESPGSILTNQDFNKTDAHFLGQVNYLYRSGAIRQIASANSAYIGSFATLNSMLTGYFRNSYEGQERTCQYARELTRQSQVNTVSGVVDGVWDGCYDAINVANSVIKGVDGEGVTLSAANKKQYLGEAKFFRGFNYFFLVKTFGDVPLSTEPFTDGAANMNYERTAKATIMELVVNDLKDAVASLVANKWQDANHRITKYVAEMALTDVYMYLGKYAEAASTARDIINNGGYSLTTNDDLALGSAYNKLRTTDDLDEVIYAQEYDNTVSTSGWWPTYAFSGSATSVFSKYSIFERVFGPLKASFLNIYDEGDLRAENQQFFVWEYTNQVDNKTWKAASADEFGAWYYFDQEAMEVTGRGTKDWNVYRYAETLLDAAEAIAQSSGVNAEAAGYLAQVQSRALGKTVAELTSVLQALSKEKFIEACWTERLREFPLEFKIWDDCVRTMKFPVISSTKRQVTYVDLIGATNGSGETFKQSDLVWPISENEIQRNPKLKPTEGYQY